MDLGPVVSTTSTSGLESIDDVLEAWAAEQPDKVAVRFHTTASADPQALTGAQLNRWSAQLASELGAHAQAGDRAMLLMDTSLEFVVAMFACLRSGVIAVPAYAATEKPGAYRHQRLLNIWADSTPALTLTRSQDWPEDIVAGPWVGAPAISVDQIDVERKLESTPRCNDLSAVAILQYTSGSTASPKGVMVTQRNVVANCATMQRTLQLTSSDVGVFWLPLFHDMGLVGGVLLPFLSKMTTNLMAPTSFVHRPERWLELISEYRGSLSAVPSFALDLTADRSDALDRRGIEVDLSSMRSIVIGAEPIRERSLDRFSDAFESRGLKRRALAPAYGMAEGTLMVTGSSPQEEPYTSQAAHTPSGSAVSCGRRADDFVVEIVDPASGELVADGDVGEICFEGESVAAGYWGQTVETARSFSDTRTSNRRRCRSGDEGFLLDGQLYVTGRIKDVIVVRGSKIHPEDVEALATSILERSRIACFGVEDEAGEHIILLIRPRGGEKIDEDVVAKVRSHVSTGVGVAPSGLVFVRGRSFPLTTSGKVRRQECKRMFLAGEVTPVSAWYAPNLNLEGIRP